MLLRCITICSFAAAAIPACGSDTLPEILARLDAAAASFKGMTAQIRRLDHTAVINDTSEERGAVTLQKTPKGVRGLVDNSFPDKKTIAFTGRQFRFYLPKINTIQVYDIGKRRDQVDQFLVLGFGTSGKELQKSYGVRLTGADMLNGVRTSKLELTPKSPEVLELFQRLELWIPEGGSHAIQQKVHLKGGDYKLMTYTDIKINPPLTEASFDLKAPKNAKTEYIGK